MNEHPQTGPRSPVTGAEVPCGRATQETRKRFPRSPTQKSHDAFGFFFLNKMEEALFFFFSFRLSSSAVEFESVEFSSSTAGAPEKLRFSAATRMLPGFLRRSIEGTDANGGRGRSSGSAAAAAALSGVAGEGGSVWTKSSVDVRILRGGTSSALAALLSSWLLLGRTSWGGSDGLLSPTMKDTLLGADVPPEAVVGREESANSSASSSVSSRSASFCEEAPLDLTKPMGSVLGRSGMHRRLSSDATLDTDPALIPAP